MRRTPLIPVAVSAFALLATAFAPVAHAAEPVVVADGLVSPLSVAVAADGTVFASQNFASLLTKVEPGMDKQDIFADEGGREIGALSVVGDVVTFGATGDHEAKLYTLDSEGNQTEIADLWAYEESKNPDKKKSYGVAGLSKSCKKGVPKKQRYWVLPYKGGVDSHPYASTTVGGTTYVADAGANAILAVQGVNDVETAAVLPASQIKITKKIRKAFKLPKCVQGKTVKTEPVPTDVEVGPDGRLYVTSLPGGPEDPAMGANGAIYAVDPMGGGIEKLGSGLVSPTGLAIGADGTAYVSMLFAGVVLAIPFGGAPEVFAEIPFPGDLDIVDDSLYVSASDLGNDGSTPPAGKVWKFDLPMG